MNSKKVTTNMISIMTKRSLAASRMRNTFVMITIVLASALLTAILMFAAGQKQQEQIELSHRQQVTYYNLTAEQVEQLKKDTRIAFQIRIKSGVPTQMDGFDVIPCYASELSDQIRVGELESGKLPQAESEIAVQAGLLQKMKAAPAVGSSVTFSFYDGSAETFTVSGILKGSSEAKQYPVFFSESYAENGSQLKAEAYAVYAKLHGAQQMYAEYCKEIMYQIAGDAGIEREYVNPSRSFLDSLSWNMQSVMLYGLVGAVILIACVLVVYGVFYLSVVGRIHQFGQFRTIGMTKRQMKKFVAREGGALFVRSAPVGIAIGVAAGYLIIPGGFHVKHTCLIAAAVFAVIYLITMISVRKPARLAAAVSPMEALRYVPQDGMKKARNKKLCRRLTPFGLGGMNFSKNRKKAAVTMFSLALGGILFMTAATYMSSFDRENFARQGNFKEAEFDIQFSSGAIELNENGMSGLQAQSPLGQDMIQEISAIDGVKKVTGIKGFGIKFDYPKQDEYDKNDIIYPLSTEECTEISSYLEEGSADLTKLLSGEYILMAGNHLAQEIYGWKFAAGDEIVLHYYDGSQMIEKNVMILGILNNQYLLDNSGFEGWFLMPEQTLLQMVSMESLNSHLLVSTQADQEAAVGEKLEQIIAEKPDFTMSTLAENRIAYAQSCDQLFGAISGLSIFIMAFSILSMMNTLITNIVTRKQELAMLESIGMSKGQIRKMLLGESMILVFAAVGVTMTAGTACGYVLSGILYKHGAYYMAFRFPVVFALAYAGVLVVVPLVITFASMKSFSKEALVQRLRGVEG